MSTDQPEGGETGRTGRTPRVGDSRSPVGSTLSIILAIVAVVAGFLILRSLRDDDDGSSDGGIDPAENTQQGDGTDISVGSGDTLATGNAPVTTVGAAKAGATIAVANASGEGGTAATMSTALVTAEYQGVGEPGNATGSNITTSVVYYVSGDTAAQAVATSLARDLGVDAPQVMPETRPATGGITETATVLVLLGSDEAGVPLAGAEEAATPPQVGATTTT